MSTAGIQAKASVVNGYLHVGDVVAHPLSLLQRVTDPAFVQPGSLQRKFDVSEYLGVTVTGVEHEGDDILRVRFSTGHEFRFSSAELHASAVKWKLPVEEDWGTDTVEAFEFQAKDLVEVEDKGANFAFRKKNAVFGRFASQMLRRGFAVIRGLPAREGVCLKFAELIGPVRNTNWGLDGDADSPYGMVFDVKVSPPSIDDERTSSTDLAYTNDAIALHVDNPYRDPMPQYQLLHCIKQSARGGASLVSDSFAAARVLRERDPETFRLLSTMPVRFFYQDANNCHVQEKPHIQVKPDGVTPWRVNFSGRLDYAPLWVDGETQDRYFRGRKALADIMAERAVSFRLGDGDLFIVDNHRVLHGRTDIDATTAQAAAETGGGRFLQGCYVDRDGMGSCFFTDKAEADGGSEEGRRDTSTASPASLKAALPPSTPPSPLPEAHKEKDILAHIPSDFTELKSATEEDVKLMTELFKVACSPQKLADRLLEMLKAQRGEEFKLGAPVDLYTHGLQTATRAMRDGADEETIVACLLHDIGELQCPQNHGEVVASLLRPFVSPETWWVLAHHEVFQGYYYFHHNGDNKNSRDVYKDHPCFQKCADFCEKWDQCSFDPNFECKPLETFAPLVLSVVSREPFWWDKEHPKRGAVTGV